MILAAWIVLAILACILIGVTEEGNLGWAAVITVAMLGILGYTGVVAGSAVWIYIKTNPWVIALLASGYFLGGTAWAIAKWWFWVKKERRRQDSKVKTSTYYKYEVPQVSHHKSQITAWMTFWPISMAWTMINDPITKAFKEIYYRISSTLQSIADKAFQGAEPR
jgi:hypothetical protein